MHKLQYVKLPHGHCIKITRGAATQRYVAGFSNCNPAALTAGITTWDEELDLDPTNGDTKSLEALIYLLLSAVGTVARINSKGKPHPIVMHSKDINLFTMAHGGVCCPAFWLDFLKNKFNPKGIPVTQDMRDVEMADRAVFLGNGLVTMDIDKISRLGNVVTLTSPTNIISVDVSVRSSAQTGKAPLRLPGMSGQDLNTWLISYVLTTGYIPTGVELHSVNDETYRSVLSPSTKETLLTFLGLLHSALLPISKLIAAPAGR